MEETTWFLPFDADTRTLQPIYAAEGAPVDKPETIAPGRPFTASLEVVRLAARPGRPWYERVMHPHNDVLILTSAALGAKPMIQRVHYYRTDIDPDRPLLAHDLLSDVVWVCDDYQEQDALYIELQVVTIDRSDEQRDATLKGFETFAGAAGGVFPVALPFIALGEGVLEGFNKLWKTLERRETERIAEPLRLFPPHTARAKTLRAGQYVIASDPIDGTQCQLGEGGDLARLDGAPLVNKGGEPVSHAVIRVDPRQEPRIEFVVSQRVATLLTQLHNDREGRGGGALETSFGFLTDTLTAYTNFTDLCRYRELLRKDTARTPGEEAQMGVLAQREDLKPFLPRPEESSAEPGPAPAG